ncbi:hypothetical protein Anapl_03035 [Anas platyrhynchos]|uniref:Uncharacterized protein n=1 Tax=Anas platyrhynchos TaxID=8839 RepID=R0LDC4_ANAPL|nr:hypothetical protein Anapl_03035 [Anas platyrhynchos]
MRGARRGPITAVLAAWEGPGMGMGHGQPPPPSTAWGAGGAATPVGTKGDPPAILVSETTSFLASSVVPIPAQETACPGEAVPSYRLPPCAYPLPWNPGPLYIPLSSNFSAEGAIIKPQPGTKEAMTRTSTTGLSIPFLGLNVLYFLLGKRTHNSARDAGTPLRESPFDLCSCGRTSGASLNQPAAQGRLLLEQVPQVSPGERHCPLHESWARGPPRAAEVSESWLWDNMGQGASARCGALHVLPCLGAMRQPSPGAEGFIPSPTHGAKTNVSILKQSNLSPPAAHGAEGKSTAVEGQHWQSGHQGCEVTSGAVAARRSRLLEDQHASFAEGWDARSGWGFSAGPGEGRLPAELGTGLEADLSDLAAGEGTCFVLASIVEKRMKGPTCCQLDLFLLDMQELLQRSSVARSGLSSYGQTHAVLMWQCKRNGLQQDAACPTANEKDQRLMLAAKRLKPTSIEEHQEQHRGRGCPPSPAARPQGSPCPSRARPRHPVPPPHAVKAVNGLDFHKAPKQPGSVLSSSSASSQSRRPPLTSLLLEKHAIQTLLGTLAAQWCLLSGFSLDVIYRCLPCANLSALDSEMIRASGVEMAVVLCFCIAARADGEISVLQRGEHRGDSSEKGTQLLSTLSEKT